MNDPKNIIVIGGGLAGAKTAEALRDQGFTGDIVLVAGEDHLPYERPPLSKDHLAGKAPFEDALVHPADWYREQRIDLRQGVRAESFDPTAHRVALDDGSTLDYDRLVLATGSTPRALELPGADADGVLSLRTIEDSDAIRAGFGADRRMVFIGGGWIGLEVAATACAAGTAVTVLERDAIPLQNILGAQIAQAFADLHIEHGVDLRTQTNVAAIETADGHVTGVRLADGEVIAADTVIIGVGAIPNVQLAKDAGLDVDNGVLVDAALRTSAPDVFAVGDIAAHQHPLLGRRIRVEHWATALNQPTALAATLLGTETPYTELPYFFSDQFDLGMEYLGTAGPDARTVVRGDLAKREFVAFWLDDADRITAVMNVNIWDVIDEVKPLILAGTPVDPARLADPDVPYTAL